MSVEQWWWLGLAIAAVVVTVVAVLLGLIIATARRIDEHAHEIWVTGKEIAGHTAAIWMLQKVADMGGRVQRAVDSIEQSSGAIARSARGRSAEQGG